MGLVSIFQTMRCYFYYNFRISKLYYLPTINIIEISSFCNYKCKFCPMNSDSIYIKTKVKRKREHMSFDDFKNIIFKYKKNISSVLSIAEHGESLTHPEFYKFVKHLIENNIKYSITTNGSLLTETKTKLLNKYPPEYIVFSLYSLDKKRYSGLCVGGNLDLVLKNINYFIKNKNSKTKIIIRTINMPQLSGEIDKFKKYFVHPDISFQFGVLNSWGGRVDIEKIDPKNIKNHIKLNKYCIRPWADISIHSDFGVFVCNNHEDDEIDNLLKSDLKKIWNSNKYINIRRNILSGKIKKNEICKNCDTYCMTSITQKPTIFFIFGKTFYNRLKLYFGFMKNIDWTSVKK